VRQPCGGLATGFFQHPRAQVADQSGRFGDRDEAVRRHLAEFCAVPAQQGLGAGQASGSKAELGLVVHLELVPFHRLAKAVFQVHPFVHLRIEQG